jgi:hypothetical protein
MEDDVGAFGSLGSDPGGSLRCGQCGWQGAEAAVGKGGLDQSDGLARGCPRCGATVAPALPTIEVIRAARQARDA